MTIDDSPNDNNLGQDNSDETISSWPNDETEDKIPSTPCVRICRYNQNFYDGQVCIGCFREAYDIGAWVSFDATERLYALEDALDRCKGDDEDDKVLAFQGSISQKALEQQVSAYRRKVEEGDASSF